MGNFNRGGGGFGGGGRKFGGGSRDRDFGDRPRPEMHPATCNKCGRSCEVPFRPTGERPVFCQDCFRKEAPMAPGKFGGRDAGRPSFEDKRMFEATCNKCGSRCEVPFRPTGEKPVYCRACFGQGQNDGGPVSRSPEQQFKVQLDIINTKLDKIMKVLIPNQPQPTAFVAKPAKELFAAAKPIKELFAAPKPAKEMSVAAKPAKEAAPQVPAAEAKPTEAAVAPKAKKAAGKKAPAKKAVKK